MIKLVAGIIVRSCVELALVLFAFAGLFLFIAYRLARRFATTTPDRFDKLAGTLSTALGIAAGRAARSAAADDELDELDELDDEPVRVTTNEREVYGWTD